MKVLLVEDNTALAESIGQYLEERGHSMDYAYDGRSGLNLANKGEYDVLTVDIGLPRMSGLALCRELRKQHKNPVPILILTARDTLDDKVEGFEAGVDDYMVKPFALKELEVRLQALYRRTLRNANQHVLTAGTLTYNLDSQRVEREGVPLLLNAMPRKILEVLMRNAGLVVRRQTLENELWPDGVPSSDVLRVHIHALRTALDSAFEQPMLETIHGYGYRLIVDDANNTG